MKKQLNILSLIFVLIGIILFFNLNVFAQDVEVPEVQTVQEKQIEQTSENVTNVNKDVYKEYLPKEEIEKKQIPPKKGLSKFFMAMLGVFISSIIIFAGLKLYIKLVLKNKRNSDNINYDKDLESPKNFKEAINLFLKKTDKF